MEMLTGLIAPYLTWLLAAGGAILGALGIWFGGKKAGKEEAKAKQMEANYNAERSRNQVDADVQAASRTGDQRVHQRWQRD